LIAFNQCDIFLHIILYIKKKNGCFIDEIESVLSFYFSKINDVVFSFWMVVY